jgi:hypothetical protein
MSKHLGQHLPGDIAATGESTVVTNDRITRPSQSPPRDAHAIRSLLSLLSHLEDAQPPPDLVTRTMSRVEQFDALGPLASRFI